MPKLTISEYAKQQNRAESVIRRKIKMGRLEAMFDGHKYLIDTDVVGDLDTYNSNNPSGKTGRAGELFVGMEETRVLQGIKKHDNKSPTPISNGNSNGHINQNGIENIGGFKASPLEAAKIKKEQAVAAMKQMELEELKKNLVKADKVKSDAFKCARLIRDAILRIPQKVSPQIASEHDVDAIEILLDKELRSALEIVANTDIGEFLEEDKIEV